MPTLPPRRRRSRELSLSLVVWCVAAATGPAQPGTPVTPGANAPGSPGPRPLAPVDVGIFQKLRSPRATLQTLYYAVDVYDYHPQLIDDAVACLDLGTSMPPDSASAALLAVQLECVLKSLDIPLASVADNPDSQAVTFSLPGDDKGPCQTLSLQRGRDGLWRFDRATVEAVPLMYRVAQGRQKNMQVERSALRERYTDARATMRRFMGDCFRGDFAAAAQALDLSGLSTADRRERGPALAQMLAFVLQRRGYVFSQLLPENPNAPAFTWHADRDGRITLDRVHPPEGKDAWLFTRQTVQNLPKMYAAAQPAIPDTRYVRINFVVPPLRADGTSVASAQRPATVPAALGSPRALLRGFFRAMDAAETSDAKLTEALDCLDLGAIPDADRRALGATLAGKLDAVLRALRLDLTALPDAWDASPQILGESRGLRVELLRQKNGRWCVSDATVARIPELFEKLTPKERAGRERSGQFDSARDTTATFLSALSQYDLTLAARCLDLSDYLPGASTEVGPVLAYKLKYVLDRTGRIYIQEVPDDPDGQRYTLYRGELGRIVLARKADGARKGAWLFTPETVERIEPMFRAVAGRAPDPSLRDEPEVLAGPRWWEVPGVWLRLHLPPWAVNPVGPLAAYQWLGLALTVLVSAAVAYLALAWVHHLVAWLLRKGGSTLSTVYVARKLRPLTWLAAWWLFFRLLGLLDLPADPLDGVLALKKFLLAGLVGWLGCRLVDLVMAIYSDSELLRPHRSLGDMIAPVTVRAAKAGVVLFVLTYVIYQIGQGELLGRFLTGLGVAGLAASLAAQDALKSFFGTLLLIGERSFKIGDRILVNGQEGVVEQVGFRSTRLRTPDESLLTIPNSTIANASIDNRGARPPKAQAA